MSGIFFLRGFCASSVNYVYKIHKKLYKKHPEIGENRRMECLYTRFPLPVLQCVGYSVKLKKI